MLKFHTDDASVPGSDCWLAEVNLGSFENKALENEFTEARSTQNSKTKHLNLENEAPKTRKGST